MGKPPLRELENIIEYNDYYDLAYGMGIEFASKEIIAKYPKKSEYIINLIEEFLINDGEIKC